MRVSGRVRFVAAMIQREHHLTGAEIAVFYLFAEGST